MTRGDLEQLRFVGAADVFKNGHLVARLERTESGGVLFTSLADVDVATSLPAGAPSGPGVPGALPPFFANLLPEGHRLSVVRRAAKTSLDDELTLLLAVGTDLPGDVQVVPAGGDPEPAPAQLSGEAEALDFAEVMDIPDSHGLPGVQPKASASMLTAPVWARGIPQILKVDPPEYPHLVRNEAEHLRAAGRLGLPTAQTQRVTDRRGREGLLVTRFDRIVGDAGVRRVAMEDAAQVLRAHPAQKYELDTEEVITALADLTRAPLIARRNLFLQFLFAWLTGNGDLHAKNVSVLASGPGGSWEVAPIYDVPSTVIYGDSSSALPVDGRVRNIRARHWQSCAAALGLPPRAAQSTFQVALRAAAAVDWSALPFTGSPLRAPERELRWRRAELEA